MNKKIIYSTIITLCFISINAFSQNVNDAIRYSSQYPEGTARSIAMGNALTAVGGDMGGITINPASSGIYRYSEVVFTPSYNNFSTNTNYLNTNYSINKGKLGISNFGYVGSFDTGRNRSGLVNWNIGLVYNKQNNFTMKTKAGGVNKNNSWLGALAENTAGYTSSNMDLTETDKEAFYRGIPWSSVLAWNTSLMDLLPGTNNEYFGATEVVKGKDVFLGGDLNQLFVNHSEGNKSETVFNFGGNISNVFYFGFNIGVQSIYYKTTESYSENATTKFANGFNSFSREYRLTTNGTGVNLKAGFIYTPPGGFRIGASISTPTWFYMNEEWEENINAQFTDGYNQTLYSPLGTYEYKLNTPFVYNVGIAYTLKPFATISADYQYIDIPGSKFRTTDNSYDQTFDGINKEMKNFKGQNILRVGAEGIINHVLSVRAGYQYYSDATKGNSAFAGVGDFERHYVSGGLGFNLTDGFFIDLSYIQRIKGNTERFNLYSSETISSPEGTNKMNSWKILLSIGMRF